MRTQCNKSAFISLPSTTLNTNLTLLITVIIQLILLAPQPFAKHLQRSEMLLPRRMPPGGRALTTALHTEGEVKSCSTKRVTRRSLRDLFGVCIDTITTHKYNWISYSPFVRVPRTTVCQKELPHPRPQSLTSSRTTLGRHCKQISCSVGLGTLGGKTSASLHLFFRR
eukprot:1147609-Amphidinium_carterae.1